MQRVELYVRDNVPLQDDLLCTSEAIAKCKVVEKELKHSDREKFIVLHLNVKNQVVSYEVVSIGSLSNSIVHPREVFKGAILANAAHVILLHNHPSGEPEPSEDDIEVTAKLMKAGKLLCIDVLDHIIIGSGTDKWCSLRRKRLL